MAPIVLIFVFCDEIFNSVYVSLDETTSDSDLHGEEVVVMMVGGGEG